MTILELPDTRLYQSWVEGMQEFGSGPFDGSGYSGTPDHELTLDAMSEVIRDRLEQARPGPHLPEGFVPCTYTWIVEDDEFMGFVAIRHTLTPFLRDVGGHIGYSVRPGRRRQGLARNALALAVVRARDLGIEDVLVTCDEANTASRRVIEANGGSYEDSRSGKRRYWIREVVPT